jgi:hypothetical protein
MIKGDTAPHHHTPVYSITKFDLFCPVSQNTQKKCILVGPQQLFVVRVDVVELARVLMF